MSSYLIDRIYTFNSFPGMSWGDVRSFPVHFKCHELWLNNYNKSYSKINDFFWESLYYLFFGQECTRILRKLELLLSVLGIGISWRIILILGFMMQQLHHTFFQNICLTYSYCQWFHFKPWLLTWIVLLLKLLRKEYSPLIVSR